VVAIGLVFSYPVLFYAAGTLYPQTLAAFLLVASLWQLERLDREALFLALYLGGGMAYAIYFTRIRFRLPFDWLLIAVDAMFLARLLARKQEQKATAASPIEGTDGRQKRSGDDLLSRAVSRGVPSALEGLTSVFGMGTGVTPPI
jgi:hypothetical protein